MKIEQAKQIDDGGPAFPVLDYIKPDVVASPPGKEGMSIRMWLAGMATDADVQAYRTWHLSNANQRIYTNSRIEARFRYADAMIAASRKDAAPPETTDG